MMSGAAAGQTGRGGEKRVTSSEGDACSLDRCGLRRAADGAASYFGSRSASPPKTRVRQKGEEGVASEHKHKNRKRGLAARARESCALCV